MSGQEDYRSIKCDEQYKSLNVSIKFLFHDSVVSYHNVHSHGLDPNL